MGFTQNVASEAKPRLLFAISLAMRESVISVFETMNTNRQSRENPTDSLGRVWQSIYWPQSIPSMERAKSFLEVRASGRSLHEVRRCRPDLWSCRADGFDAVRRCSGPAREWRVHPESKFGGSPHRVP